MQTEKTQEVERRPRRVWWIVGLTVLAVSLIGVGIWAIVAANQTDDIDVATELVDDWIAGWNAEDSEAVAAVFTEDGTYVGTAGDSVTGREALVAHASVYHSTVSDAARTGDLVAMEEGSFRFPMRFAYPEGVAEGTVELELEGDLAARIEWMEWSAA